MHFRDFQDIIDATYGDRDRARGRDGTFRRLTEEIGELARALRTRDPIGLREEFSDVLARTVSLASLCAIDTEEAISRYAQGCPKCGQRPCACSSDEG